MQPQGSFNYNPLATVNWTSATDSTNPCIPYIYGCTDPTATNYIQPIGDPLVDVNTDDASCSYTALVYECTDPNCYHDFEVCNYPGTVMNFMENGASSALTGSQQHFDAITSILGTISIGDVIAFDDPIIPSTNDWVAQCFKYLGPQNSTQAHLINVMTVNSTAMSGWTLYTDCATCQDTGLYHTLP
jgi:hypothetical protein